MQIVGETFGKLRVLFMWLEDRYVCRCGECGEHVEMFRSVLVDGIAKRCMNCRNNSNGRRSVHGHVRAIRNRRTGKHRSKATREYHTYMNMKRRCLNPKHHAYADYGGRGIKVCAEWLEPEGQGFHNFLMSMGPRPQGETLDRINVQGHYEPSNCRWATWDEQGLNRRPNIFRDGIEPPVLPLVDNFSAPDNFDSTGEF